MTSVSSDEISYESGSNSPMAQANQGFFGLLTTMAVRRAQYAGEEVM